MATIRFGTAATGKIIWTVPKVIAPTNLNPQPPDPTPMPTAKATIVSFQTPVQVGQTARAVAQITQGQPQQFRWQYLSGAQWQTAATNPASDLDHHYLFTKAGKYPIRLQTLVNGVVVDQTGTARVIEVTVAPQPPEPQPPDPTQPPVPGPGQILVRVLDTHTHGPIHGAKVWAQTAPSVITLTDANGYSVVTVSAGGVCALKDGYHSPGVPTQIETCMVIAATVILGLEPVPPPPTALKPLHPDGHIFRTPDGAGWRWKGVSAFQLCDRWVRGENIGAFLSAYQGYNTLRVWAYTEGPNWTDPTWNSPPPQRCVDFVAAMNALGWYVEWTLLTSSNKARQSDAIAQIQAFTSARLSGLFLEASNEPEVQHDGIVIDTEPLKPALTASGYPYTNGYYKNTNKHWGTYLTTHTQRDSEWPRRSHDAMDIYNPPADAPPGTLPKHMPIILDEPAKTQDVSGDKVGDWKAYFGSGSFFGAGVTFHSQTGKFAQPPTGEEAQLAAAGLVGLNAFPVEAPLGAYSRVDDSTLRTYIYNPNGSYYGEGCMVRIRPTTPNAPQPGWIEMDAAHILWRR